MRLIGALYLLPACLMPTMTQAANYTIVDDTVDGIAVIRLRDAAHHTEVGVAPPIGNNVFAMKVNGKDVFWVPFKSLGEMRTKPAHFGNPFLAPWANRLDQDAFYANGKKYPLNTELANFRRDANQKPIHGLLVYSPHWKVTARKADAHAAAIS